MAATPTLLGIPTECRTQILRYVLDDQFSEVAIANDSANVTKIQHTKYMPYPLLLVCRKIHMEAIGHHQITLTAELTHTIADYTNMLRQDEYLRQHVTKIILKYDVDKIPVGYRADIINKDIFPNLTMVLVRPLIRYLHSPTNDIVAIREVPPVFHITITTDAHPKFVIEEFERGDHDSSIVALSAESNLQDAFLDDLSTEAKRRAGEERGFDLLCKNSIRTNYAPLSTQTLPLEQCLEKPLLQFVSSSMFPKLCILLKDLDYDLGLRLEEDRRKKGLEGVLGGESGRACG